MKKVLEMLMNGFESSSVLTPEFAKFYKTFKREFTKELKSVGATNIVFNRGHFYVSGFCTINGQVWYFSLSDVRGMEISLKRYPNDYMSMLMYRTANNYKDSCGGYNRWAKIGVGMCKEMFSGSMMV